MSGFIKSQFFNLRPKEEELFSCQICLNILNDPMITPCCHQTYCCYCIVNWIEKHNTCPKDSKPLNKNDLVIAPTIITNLVKKLQVFCDYRHKGCEKIVNLEELVKHSEECEFKLDKVCTICGDQYANDSSHDCSEGLLFDNICLKRENCELKGEIQKLEKIVENMKSDFAEEIENLKEKIESIEKFVDENLVTLMNKSEFIKKECENFQKVLSKAITLAEKEINLESVERELISGYGVKEQCFDFRGRFKLICTDDINEYLEVLGVSFVARKLLIAQNPMIDISVENGLFSIKTITPFKTTEIKFFFGVEFEEQRVDGKTVRTVINAVENKLIQTQFDEKEVMIIREFINDCIKVITTVFYEESGQKKNVTIIQFFQKI